MAILSEKARRLVQGVSIRRVAAAVGLSFFGVIAAFGIAPNTVVETIPTEKTVEELELPPLVVLPDAAGSYTHEERIQRGDTVAALLARLGVQDPEAVTLLRTSRQARSFHQLIPGRTVRATVTADGKLIGLRYLNGSNLISVDRASGGLEIREQIARLETRVLMKSAEIRNSLFGATDAAGLSDAVATQIADIFSSDIDFHRDLRKGDRFTVLYEVYYHMGEPVKTGRILAAEFVNQGKSYQTVYYQYSESEGGYYTLDGKNLRKQFLRSPLEFSRVTSGFSNARFHPLLQVTRAHRGIDYGAPTGTRVKATADGVVDFAGRESGYGNLIVLRHQSTYTTYYGHLSGFAKGLHKGKRVMQGEVIGYVGMTGLATGPHLHYEFRANNVQQNPLRVAMPSAPPILAERKAAFEQAVRPLAHQIELLRGTNLARLD
jgi:murein DD-endopeptidase MepM/ murein hydrolase activator NlpD